MTIYFLKDNYVEINVNGLCFTGSDLYPASPKKITPSMVKLPIQSGPSVNQSKSTNNLARPSNEKTDTRKSAPDIPQVVNQSTKTTSNLKEQKKLEKQRLADQKKQEKLAEKERQREEKLRKEREKLIAQQTRAVEERPKKVEQRKTKKRAAPQPQQEETQNPAASNPNQRQQYSTNTLESSISKTSGPPPYSSVPEVSPTRINVTETSIAKPAADMDSWGLISQHRQQMNMQAGIGKSAPKQKLLDLRYNAGNSSSNDNENSNV